MAEGSRAVVIGLGSNLGSRGAFLAAAVQALRTSPGVRVTRLSKMYRTAPLGPPQPDYLNAAVRVETELSLEALHGETLGIERALGRERRERWGPRTIDLDLLFSDGPPLSTASLSVPHPRLAERAFALAPLLDVLDDPDPTLREALGRAGGPPGSAEPFPCAPAARAVRDGARVGLAVEARDQADAAAAVLTAWCRHHFEAEPVREIRSVHVDSTDLGAAARALWAIARAGWLPWAVTWSDVNGGARLHLLGRPKAGPVPLPQPSGASVLVRGDGSAAHNTATLLWMPESGC